MQVISSSKHKVTPCVNDSLGRILFPSKLTHLLTSTLCAFLLSTTPLFAAMFFGLFQNSELSMDAAHDVGYWCIILMTCGLILSIGLWQESLAAVFSELRTLGVSTRSDQTFENFVGSTRKTYGKVWVTFPPYIIAFVITLAGIATFHRDPLYWHSLVGDWQKRVCCCLQVAPCFVAWYVGFYALTHLLATYFVLRDFFKESIRVDPLHPDGCGGLYPLGRLSMRLNLIVIVFGLLVAVAFYVNTHTYMLDAFHPVNLILIASYALISIVVFFLPLYAARSSMYEAKMAALHYCEQLRQTLSDVISEKIKKREAPSSEQVAELHRVDKLFVKINQMPIYPFNTKIVASFILSWIAPMLAPFWSAFADKLF